MNELIKKLKDKNYVRAFGLLSLEEQECLRKANKDGAVILYNHPNEWQSSSRWNFSNPSLTYAIKPDYQPEPEPEFVDLEIVKHSQGTVEQTWWLGAWKYSDLEEHKFLPHLFTHLHCLPSLPRGAFHYFEKFWFNDEEGNICKIHIEDVPSAIAQGCKVFARFRK